MLSTPEFAAWSKKVVLFLHNTSKVDDEPYPDLLYQNGGIGFPTMSYLAADGRLLTQVGHITPVEQLEEAFQKLVEWKELRRKVEVGADDLAEKLFRLEIDRGLTTFVQASEAAKHFEFSDADKQKIEQQLVNMEFNEILRATPRSDMASGGEKFLAMFRAGRIPNNTLETSYWQYMFEYAGAEKDVKLFGELLDYVREHKQDDPRLRRYGAQLERQYEALKRAVGG